MSCELKGDIVELSWRADVTQEARERMDSRVFNFKIFIIEFMSAEVKGCKRGLLGDKADRLKYQL